jgi:hypothetical protein
VNCAVSGRWPILNANHSRTVGRALTVNRAPAVGRGILENHSRVVSGRWPVIVGNHSRAVGRALTVNRAQPTTAAGRV